MLYLLGRLLQIVGLILLPVGVAGNLARPEEVTLAVSLGIAGVGVAVFALGWLLQQKGKPS
ncbi:MAG: hypothetical protein NZ700_00930 [Gemmataceae bacterium]|nr:hypothetical protein [Gemmataceae bacterium]MDW8265780.1 hypothetical protein [Gemmataceae bacterium]